MSRNANGPLPTRRRGKELEDALLSAAREELLARGYSQFTIEGVAERAATSRHVIYRRWSTREELAVAALRRDVALAERPAPDTGTVRGDVISVLTAASRSRLETAAFISLHLGTYYLDTGRTMEDLRNELLEGRAPVMDIIVARGIARGEIDPSRVTPRIMRLPADLLRHDALMTLKPISASAIAEIVDEIFLPLVRPL